jgi:tRNA pseudouridine13 synthase
MIASPEQDRELGIEYYITDNPGCAGLLRSDPEDFRVEEVYQNLGYEGGRYLVLEVEKKDWDTHHLIREMSRQLRISQRRFSWAGTKDKRAITRQRISIMNLDESELKRITLPNIGIKVLGRTNRAVGLGDLLGNRFNIRIRNLDCDNAADLMARTTEAIGTLKGLPNYFGVQRFGDTRPVTHRVGEALAKGDMERAAFTYLALPFPGEPLSTRSLRTKLWEGRDIPEALRNYPTYLRYELAMLNYLVEHPGDFEGSFNVLSMNLRRLFIHAYQSYIFNRILSRRLASALPIDRAIYGDIVCFARGDLPDTSRLSVVTEENIDAIGRLVSRGRAYVTLPLVGYESSFASGDEGDIERTVLKEEGVDPEGFLVKQNPDLGSKGTRRPALLRVSPRVKLADNFADIEFFLPAGGYATVVLREYMKSGNLKAE